MNWKEYESNQLTWCNYESSLDCYCFTNQLIISDVKQQMKCKNVLPNSHKT
jgi:hypothetical protein